MNDLCTEEGGGQPATTQFKHVIFAAAEAHMNNGNRPEPACLVMSDGQHMQRFVRRDLQAMRQAPFDTGPDTLLVAYGASTVLRAHLALGWKTSENIVCLDAQFRIRVNGRGIAPSFSSALATHGLGHISVVESEPLQKIIQRGSWSNEEVDQIVRHTAEFSSEEWPIAVRDDPSRGRARQSGLFVAVCREDGRRFDLFGLQERELTRMLEAELLDVC
jgi:hypothetical protein